MATSNIPEEAVLKRFIAVRERANRGEGAERDVAQRILDRMRREVPGIEAHADAWVQRTENAERLRARATNPGGESPFPFANDIPNFRGYQSTIREQRSEDPQADHLFKRFLWDGLEWLGRKADEGLQSAGFEPEDPGPWAKDKAPTADNNSKRQPVENPMDESNPFYRAVEDGDMVADFCVEVTDKRGKAFLEHCPEDEADVVSIEVTITIDEWRLAQSDPAAFVAAIEAALTWGDDEEAEAEDEAEDDA